MHTIVVLIDDIGINATHFGAMEKAEAVQKMIDDGITQSEEWAEKVYDICVEKLKA